jgi:hypothetical protein
MAADPRFTYRPSKSTDFSGAAARTTTGAQDVDVATLFLCWRRDRQTFGCGDAVFVNEGRTSTNPSHDLAHLLIAANGGLPWHPVGETRRLAEYNAVFIEHLLDQIYNFIIWRASDASTVLRKTLHHARWFVEEHYAPFPVPAEEAYRLFCWEVDPSTIGRLSPLFFQLRSLERRTPDVLDECVEIRFDRHDTPPAVGGAIRFSNIVSDVVGRIGRPH